MRIIVPAPTGVPMHVRSMPSSDFWSSMPSMSPRLGGMGYFFSSAGEVTWPWMSMIMRGLLGDDRRWRSGGSGAGGDAAVDEQHLAGPERGVRRRSRACRDAAVD